MDRMDGIWGGAMGLPSPYQVRGRNGRLKWVRVSLFPLPNQSSDWENPAPQSDKP